MQVARLCKYWSTASCTVRQNVALSNPGFLTKRQPSTFIRNFNEDVKTTRRRRIEWRQKTETETSHTPFVIGRAAAIGGGVFGIGALCYYGIGLGEKPGFIEHAMIWPQYVKERVHSTYLHFGASLLVTAGSAALAFRSPLMMNYLSRNSLLVLGASMAAMIGTGEICRSITYKPGFGPKQVAWLAHSAVVGAVIAPMCIFGGPLLMRAAWLTAGVVGGLSTVAVCAPSDKFLYMGGPLAMGLGVVVASSIGTYFLPPVGLLGASLYSISVYGGLLVMSGFMLYDTQRIIHAAESHYDIQGRPYDPINMSISIYLDTINIFIRLVSILASGGSGNKR